MVWRRSLVAPPTTKSTLKTGSEGGLSGAIFAFIFDVNHVFSMTNFSYIYVLTIMHV
jgi:hypothetical protein